MTRQELESKIREIVGKEPRCHLSETDDSPLRKVTSDGEYEIRIMFKMQDRDIYSVVRLTHGRPEGDFLREVANMVECATEMIDSGRAWVRK